MVFIENVCLLKVVSTLHSAQYTVQCAVVKICAFLACSKQCILKSNCMVELYGIMCNVELVDFFAS